MNQINANKIKGTWLSQDTAPKRLTQSIALEESPVTGVLRTTVTVIGSLVAVFIVWASFAKLEEVATASGQIIPSGYIQSIQHLEGGIVREILVEEGDLVSIGQPLIKLDDTSANADLGQMRARQSALKLQIDRLKNYAQGTGDKDTLTAEEKEILASMISARGSQQDVARDQISQKEKELQSITANRMALQQNVELMRKENEINQKLVKRGSASQIDALSSQRQLNALQGQLSEAISQEHQGEAAINEARNRLVSVGADLKQEAMKNIGQLQGQLDEINKGITKLESTASRTTLDAPVRGIVKGLSVHTIGAVVEPGKLLLEIVPVDKELQVEALVSPTDIGNLEVGQAVKVKVSAYDFSRYGSVQGQLKGISASTFQTERGDSFYKAKIKLDHNYVGNNSNRNLILPGMTVQADIITGEKSIMDYLLKPLHVITQTAFHER